MRQNHTILGRGTLVGPDAQFGSSERTASQVLQAQTARQGHVPILIETWLEESPPLTNWQNVKVLDCTFRDGGYQNNWQFPQHTVEKYISAAIGIGVPLVEVGFKLPPDRATFRGVTASTPWSFFEKLPRGPQTSLGFMINSSDYSIVELEQIMNGFEPHPSGLDFARLATDIEGIEVALSQSMFLASLGLKTYVNIMKASLYEPELVLQKIGTLSLASLDALYFADSLGSMTPRDVKELFSTLHRSLDIPLGFHGHDNRSLALANSHEAVECGALYIDGTYRGVGRGAGNTKIEDLISETGIATEHTERFVQFLDVGDAIISRIPNMQSVGPSPEYSLAAKGQVHPSYVQDLVEKNEFSRAEMMAVIIEHSNNGLSRYSSEELNIGRDWFMPAENPEADNNLDEVMNGSPVIVVGSGTTVREFNKEIESLAEKLSLPLLGVGAGAPHDVLKFDYVCISNPISIITGALEKVPGQLPIIAPWRQVPRNFAGEISAHRKVEVGLEVSSSELIFASGRFLVLPSHRSSIYAISLAIAHGANEIYLAGFDGYPVGDNRNREFSDFLHRLHEITTVPLRSLTQTAFDLEYKPFE